MGQRGHLLGRLGRPAVVAAAILVATLSPAPQPMAAGHGPDHPGPSSARPYRAVPNQAQVLLSAESPPTAIRPVAATRSGHSVLFGSYLKPLAGETRQQAMARMEARIGRRFSIDHVYHAWTDSLIGPYERWSSRRGHVLLINWKAVLPSRDGTSNGSAGGYVRWADIAAGKQDSVIRARAIELKRFGKLVYLNFHHEPEDDRDLPGWRRAGTPSDYRAAWKHIRAIFRQEHVTNVRFVLILMGSTFRGGRALKWFPGSRVVDVIGADGYNWFGTARPGSSAWITFASAFSPGYRFAQALGKPFWVTETGVLEDPGRPGRKAQWYRDMDRQIKAWPDLGAVVYFVGGKYGWDPESSSRSFAAFRAVARDPYFT